jgi:hypothetical protein
LLSPLQEPPNDLQGRAVQVDELRVALALRFLLGDDDDGSVQVYVPRLDMPGLLRSAAGVPDEEEQVAEGVAFPNPSDCLRHPALLFHLALIREVALHARNTIGPQPKRPSFHLALIREVALHGIASFC